LIPDTNEGSSGSYDEQAFLYAGFLIPDRSSHHCVSNLENEQSRFGKDQIKKEHEHKSKPFVTYRNAGFLMAKISG
jgi:hypothetical protein